MLNMASRTICGVGRSSGLTVQAMRRPRRLPATMRMAAFMPSLSGPGRLASTWGGGGTAAGPGENEQTELGLVEIAHGMQVAEAGADQRADGEQHFAGRAAFDVLAQPLIAEAVGLLGMLDLAGRQVEIGRASCRERVQWVAVG